MVCVWHVRRSSSKGLSVVLQEMTHHEGFFLWCRILFNKPLLFFPNSLLYLLPRDPGVASARDLAQNRAGDLDTHMFSEQTVTDKAQMVKYSSFACHELSEPLGTLQMY